jgi:Ribonuclease G/E
VSGTLLIAAGPGEWRAAWVEEGGAIELYVERGDSPPAGSIHLGRVVRRTPGLDAVFVDIGTERPGFLPARNAPPDLRLDEGARVIAQVRREAQQGKGARLSARIERRAGGPDARQLSAYAAQFEPPRQIEPAPSFAASLALRLPASPEHILTDDAAIVPELRHAFPKIEISCRSAENWPADLDAEFAIALASSLPLPGGGAIHIAEPAAAVLIDVDTGTPMEGSAERGAMSANLIAVEAIARQIRLRQLGGGIVVDFVRLEGRGARGGGLNQPCV